ncbi:MAG: class I SAM-dependent methyltransferase [Planctomycetes bacterium]|nr:class I SAM-dependent methyltransferase [Planctomycetota bacterium]
MRCRRCRLISLARVPAPEQRSPGGSAEDQRADDEPRLLGFLERARRIFSWLNMKSVLRRERGQAAWLDVGCGRGFLIELLRDRGWMVMGTHLSRKAAKAAQQKGLNVFCGSLPDLEYHGTPFRVVTCFHALDRLERPFECLRRIRELMEDRGLLVVEVPDCSSPGFKVLGVRSASVDYPHRLIFFTPSTLRSLLEMCGFDVVSVRHFSLEHSAFTTLQNLLNLIPGEPNRLWRAMLATEDGRRLRRSIWTWMHAGLALALALPALLLSLPSLLLPVGNTMRFLCRKGAERRIEGFFGTDDERAAAAEAEAETETETEATGGGWGEPESEVEDPDEERDEKL